MFLPIVDTALDQTVDGDEATLANTASASALYSLADEQNTPTITITADTSTITVDPATATSIISDKWKIDVTSSTLTIQTATGAPTAIAASAIDAVITISVADKTVNVTGTTTTGIPALANPSVLYVVDASGTYGLYTPTTVAPVYANSTVAFIAISGTALASEKIGATSPVAITAAQYVDSEEEELKNVYSVTDAGTGGSILVPVNCVYYEQVPAFDGNLKTIIQILPILVAIGILMAAAYTFMGSTWRRE